MKAARRQVLFLGLGLTLEPSPKAAAPVRPTGPERSVSPAGQQAPKEVAKTPDEDDDLLFPQDSKPSLSSFKSFIILLIIIHEDSFS